MSLFRYSGLSTKVKAMKGRLLSPEQFREMNDLHSVPEVLSYLKKMPSYEKVLADKDEAHLHRGAAEALVKQSLYYDFGKLYRFADLEQRVFLEDYFMRYEVIFLKNVLRYLFDSNEDRADIDLSAYQAVFERHSEMDPNVLMQAESVLLEPWYSFTAEADAALAGRILSDIPRMGGRYEAPVTGRDGRVAVTGTCPVAQMQAYARELTALGKGRTQLSLAFEAYHPCTPAQQQYLVEQTGYDPERDVENTPDSVFCSHGAGYPVKWNEAPAQMHIQLK